MDKHEKAQIVRAITLLQKKDCRKEEALEILHGLVGLDYATSRQPEKDVSGSQPGRSRLLNIDREKEPVPSLSHP